MTEASTTSQLESTDTSSAITGSLLNAVLQASDEAIFTKKLNGTITSWSHGAQTVYGYDPTEIIGKNVTTLMPVDRKHEAQELLSRVRSGQVVTDYQTRRMKKSGELINLTLTMSPIRDEDGVVVGALTVARGTQHMHEFLHMLRVLSERERDHSLVLNAAQHVALDILSSQTGIEALRHIAEASVALTGAKYGAIGVARNDGIPGLQQFVTVGLTSEEEARIGPKPRGLGVLGVLLERTEPLRIDTIGTDPSSVGFPPNHPIMTSFLGVPIRSGHTVLGSLYLADKAGGGPFTEADELAIQALGAHAAVAIHNLLMLSRQRALVTGLIMAQEEERRAVAYDLHDGLTQYVMASHAHLDAFRRAQASGNTTRSSRELELGLKYLREAVVESRRMVNGLRTLTLDDLGLAGALEQAVEEEARRAGWTDTDFVHNIAGQRFDPALETTIFRIAQEALTNAHKHSQTNRIRLTLILDEQTTRLGAGRRLRLEVRDWGRGFDIEQAGRDESRVGLSSMFERVRNLDGEWSLISVPGEGTIVRAVFSIRPSSKTTEE